MYEADALKLFDGNLFLKEDAGKSFPDDLKTLSNLPKIELMWLESNNYTLDLDIFENITISSTDLYEADVAMDIKLKIENLDGYYLEQQNFDLCLHDPRRNFAFLLKAVFESDLPSPFLIGVSISNALNIFTSPTIVKRYTQQNQPVYVSDGVLDTKVSCEANQRVYTIF